MKNLITVMISVIMIAGTVQAQDTSLKRDQIRSGIQKRDRIHQEEHLLFQDGKLYQMRKGVRNEVKSQIKLKNGTVVNPDGSYALENQERLRMSNGECMDMSGRVYKNQNMFNQRRMMNHAEMQRHRDMNRTPGKGTKKKSQKGAKGPVHN